jgi:exosortase/archaeosortase family protein
VTALDPRLALLVPLLGWESWRLLAGRYGDGLSALPLTLVGLAAAVPALRSLRAGSARPVPLLPLSLGLLCYAAASLLAPPLIAGAVAAVASMFLLRFVAGNRLRWAPEAGLVLLALPVLPSLDFYLAYPMRLLGAALTACLLRLNGMAVTVEGVALRWGETLLLFDAACSGIRMLWVSLFLVSVLALLTGFSVGRYAAALAIAVAMAIVGNAVRAASLFYLENGFVAPLQGPIAHEAVGLAAFLLFAALTLWLVAPRQAVEA